MATPNAKESTMQLRQRKTDDPNEKGNDASQNATAAAPKLLVNQPSSKRWKSFWVRTIATFTMAAMFLAILYTGHNALAIFVVVCQAVIFREILRLANEKAAEAQVQGNWFLNWYFFVVAIYFVYGRALRSYFKTQSLKLSLADSEIEFQTLFERMHYFNSFSLYVVGFVIFVLLLKPGHYRYQFKHFAWTHITVLLVVVSSSSIMLNIYHGIFWFLLPSTLIICNDITAYLSGFFFGKTSLTHLSPNKTWEGFIGATICTFIWAFFFPTFVHNIPQIVCPKYDVTVEVASCTIDEIFRYQSYDLPAFITVLIKILGYQVTSVSLMPVQMHAVKLAAFASIIAPFGGFFASGFKRAFKVKDFGDTIPGHGGMTDRMDCQILMGLFVYVYHYTFVIPYKAISVTDVLGNVALLSASDQLEVFGRLRDALTQRGMI